MAGRRGRILGSLFCIGWLGGVALALRVGATALDTNPEHLLGLSVASYLAAWGPFLLFSRRGPAGKAARFAACTASIVACFAALEVPSILGFVDYRSVFATPTPPWKRPGNRPEPDLIFVKEGPRSTRQRFRGAELHGLRGASPWKTYVTDVRLDRDGFRNPAEPGAADLVVIGDSFIEGLHVSAPELITARLSEELGRPVANLGRTGYGPQQELEVLRRYGLPRRPKTCLWAFYEGNDLQDSNHYEAERRSVRRALHESRARSLYGRSFARNALSFAIHSWLRPEPGRPARQHTGYFTSRSGQGVPIYFTTGIQHGEEGPALPRGGSPEMGRFRSILAEAHALCRGQGVDLIVVFIPAKFRVYRRFCAFDRDAACLTWDVDDLPRAMEAAVSGVSAQIGYLDLTPRFDAEAAGGGLAYLPDDTHWSAEGHRLAARALADYLGTRPPIARPPAPVLTTR